MDKLAFEEEIEEKQAPTHYIPIKVLKILLMVLSTSFLMFAE